MRTRYALNSLLMFLIVSISVVKFSFGDEKFSPEVHSGLIWIIIFFSSSGGLSRIFVAEEEKGTSLLLKLSVDPSSVLAGKFLFNIFLIFTLNSLICFFYTIVTDLVVNNLFLFVVTVFLSGIGLSASMTITAAIVSKASSKGTIYPVITFPLILPLLLSAISATSMSIHGETFSSASGELQIIISYTVVICVASFMVFGYIWND